MQEEQQTPYAAAVDESKEDAQALLLFKLAELYKNITDYSREEEYLLKDLLHLETLHFNSFPRQFIPILFEILKHSVGLKNLDLAYTNFHAIGKNVEQLLLHNTTLESVNMRELGTENIGVEGVLAVARALKENKSLLKLYVGAGSCIYKNGVGITAIAKALETNTTLRTLGLYDACIRETPLTSLLEAFQKNPKPRLLDLHNTSFSSKGSGILLNMLDANTGLEGLSIRHCDLPADEAFDFIQKMTQVLETNSTLKTLTLIFYPEDQALTHAVIACFAKALKKNQALETLHLEVTTPCSDACLASIADALKVNSGLKELTLGKVSFRAAAAITHALDTNHTLQKLECEIVPEKNTRAAKKKAQLLGQRMQARLSLNREKAPALQEANAQEVSRILESEVTIPLAVADMITSYLGDYAGRLRFTTSIAETMTQSKMEATQQSEASQKTECAIC